MHFGDNYKDRTKKLLFILIVVCVVIAPAIRQYFSLPCSLFASICRLLASSLNTFPTKSLAIETTAHKQTTYKWSNVIQDWTIVANNHGHQIKSIRRQPAVEADHYCLWPEDCPSRDRIIDQLVGIHVHEPKGYIKIAYAGSGSGKSYSPQFDEEAHEQIDEACPINKCLMTSNLDKADVIIFPNADVHELPVESRRAEQIWIAYLLESPPNTFDTRFQRAYRGQHEFNWTATYRSDSDIVTPYGKFVPYEHKLNDYLLLLKDKTELYADPTVVFNDNLAHSAKVAWMVSNCNARNNRLTYARELSNYIQVDIYGKCGNGLICDKWNQTGCLEMINANYKFYLSFENSNHRDYITEKLYLNAFNHNQAHKKSILPIVMGAPKQDYQRFAPPNSFIHIDDFKSPKELANYLRILDSNDSLYRSYFRWRTMGTFIDTKFVCRVCAMAHQVRDKSQKTKSYLDIQKWWHNEIKGPTSNQHAN